MLNTLSRAEGMAGLIADTAVLAHKPALSYEINMKNMETGIREVEMTIKEALIILNDYWCNKREHEPSSTHQGKIAVSEGLEK